MLLPVIYGNSRRNKPAVRLRIGDIGRESSCRVFQHAPVFFIDRVQTSRRTSLLMGRVYDIDEFFAGHIQTDQIQAINIIHILNGPQLLQQKLKVFASLQPGII